MTECYHYKLCPAHLAGLGGAGAGAGAGAGEGLLLSSDIEREGFRDGGDTFLGGGLLYSNLMASLILALLEAVDASDMDLLFWLGLTDRLRVLAIRNQVNFHSAVVMNNLTVL